MPASKYGVPTVARSELEKLSVAIGGSRGGGRRVCNGGKQCSRRISYADSALICPNEIRNTKVSHECSSKDKQDCQNQCGLGLFVTSNAGEVGDDGGVL